MKKLFALLLILSFAFSEFRLENVEVSISNVNKDGAARVTEHIRFFVIGNYEQEKYKAGISNNDLSSWAALTGSNEVRMHIKGTEVDIKSFSLRPQTLKKCDPFSNLCHGELILTYDTYPYFNKTTKEQIKNTGLFNIDIKKPRTTRYSLNTNALNFRSPTGEQKNDSAITTTSENVIILDKNIYFTMVFPQNTVILDLSQSPENADVSTPTASISELTWTNTILGQFLLVFEVEESLDKEVVEFFANIPKGIQRILFGEQGLGIIAIIAILTISYIYLKSVEKNK